jgi:hypothetical protein
MGENELNDRKGEYENILSASDEENGDTFNSELSIRFFKETTTFILNPYPSFPTPPPLCPTPIAFLILTGHQEPWSCLEGL